MCGSLSLTIYPLSIYLFILPQICLPGNCSCLGQPDKAFSTVCSVQCTVSFKLRNRNLTLALIFQKCQLKNFKSKSAKKTRKYLKIVTFGEWDDSDVTCPSAVLLSPCPAVRCLRMHMLRICQGCDVTFWNFKWAAVTATLPLFPASLPASPLPQKWPKKPHQRPGPFAVWGTWAATFASALGSIAQPRNRLIGRPLPTSPPLLARYKYIFVSFVSKQVQSSCRKGEGKGGCTGKWALQWTKEMQLSFCVFLVFPLSIETFYVLWSALLCAHFAGERLTGLG